MGPTIARYSVHVVTYDLTDAARRSGVDAEAFGHLVELGILTPDGSNRFTSGDLRRAGLVIGLTAAGIPLEGLAPPSGRTVLARLPRRTRLRAVLLAQRVTFAEMAERTGVPVEMLMPIREAAGSWRRPPTTRA